MKRKILLLGLRIARGFGLFSLARKLTARDLRILCYHGAALYDEHQFNPGLFITEETFARRMVYLAREGYPVLSLDAALDGLRNGCLAPGATVITIDDGWYGTYKIMAPILKRFQFPATLYLATYYLTKQVPVFNVALDYILWKGRSHSLDLSQVASGLSGTYELANEGTREKARGVLRHFADSLSDAHARQQLLQKICNGLGFDWRAMQRKRLCYFMNADEAKELLDQRIDLQLHTHRHRSAMKSFDQAKSEIDDNRRVINSISRGRELRHFCYPSGMYTAQQVEWLPQLNIDTATTTKGGFNERKTSPYELRRFLDSERISMLEFEAEMSGFFELIRRCGYSI